MNNKTVCNQKDCTGCGACVKSCPKKCINLIEDEIGALVANIDENLCVDCNICRKVCHINKEKNFIFPKKVFAGWSNDEETHSNGASGGIASEIIKFGVNNNIFIMGTRFYRDKGVVFEEIKNINDLNWARDSKYVYSDMRSCFELYTESMQKNRKCIFIGLPCQVSALKSYIELKGFDFDNIILVEIICHGVPPFKYLDEHLKMIEKKKKGTIGITTWRNPYSIYLLQCKTVEDMFLYSKGMHEDDTYYRAFALNLNFRESCYKCHYARSERISDFTLGDYSGLGQLWPYDGNKQMVLSDRFPLFCLCDRLFFRIEERLHLCAVLDLYIHVVLIPVRMLH